jgi:hypothetical protein
MEATAGSGSNGPIEYVYQVNPKPADRTWSWQLPPGYPCFGRNAKVTTDDNRAASIGGELLAIEHVNYHLAMDLLAEFERQQTTYIAEHFNDFMIDRIMEWKFAGICLTTPAKDLMLVTQQNKSRYVTMRTTGDFQVANIWGKRKYVKPNKEIGDAPLSQQDYLHLMAHRPEPENDETKILFQFENGGTQVIQIDPAHARNFWTHLLQLKPLVSSRAILDIRVVENVKPVLHYVVGTVHFRDDTDRDPNVPEIDGRRMEPKRIRLTANLTC